MKALQVKKNFKKIEDIQLELVSKNLPSVSENECLVRISSSGINPSDALATMGYFSKAIVPRIPGRDFSGTVINGPKNLIGKSVWGTGGAAGIEFDGTHAEYIKLPSSAISVIPKNLDLISAGAQPLPYVTAYYSLVKRARIKAGETVLIVGALGQVGRAAMSICAWKKCHAIALVRGEKRYTEAIQLGWKAINTDEKNLSKNLRVTNNNQAIDVILNSVGNIYWQDFMSSLAELGRIITIGARENTREVTVNLFELYRANQEIIGINSLALDFVANAALLDEMRPGFEESSLIPFKVEEAMIFHPEQASTAYQQVVKGSQEGRIVIKFH